MGALMRFMDKYIIPVASKLGAQRHLVAVRDGFVAMIPITMIGALASLINNLPVKAYQKFMLNVFGENWNMLGADLWWGSIATMALFLVVSIAYSLAKSYDEDGLQAGLIALAIFFVMAPQVADVKTEAGELISAWGFIPSNYVSNSALFSAIAIGLLSTELFVKLSKIKKMTIKMPYGVPPAVAKSFAKLIPGMLTIAGFAIIGVLIKKFTGGLHLNDILNTYLATPLKGMADSLGSTMLVTFFIHALWTVGLHGANIALPVTETLLIDLGAENAALAQAGATEGYHVLAGAFFDAFVYLGGSGMILGLVIALIIAGRKRKDMIALGLAPSCFNISEPVIFGLPIVLNPIYMIPFVLAPVVCSGIAYMAIKIGWVMPVIVPKMPWVTPPIIGGIMATGHWTGGVLAAVNLLISILIYIPFVMASEKIDQRKGNLAPAQGSDDDFSFDDLEL